MVPSDPPGSLSSGRHARPERGIQKQRDVGPLLPAAGFRPAVDRCADARPRFRSW